MSDFTLPDDLPPSAASTVSIEQDVPAAFRVPTKAMNVGVLVLYCLAILVIWMSIFPLLQILIPIQISTLDLAHKIADYSLISVLGAVVSLVCYPLAGAFSDRTTSRFGRRRLWIISGAVGMVVVLLVLSHATSIALLAIGWIGFTVFASIAQAGMFAVLPDQVPAQQRAVVSAFVGLSVPIGIALGSIVVGRFARTPQLAYYLIAGLLFVFVLLFAVVMRDEPLPAGVLPAFNLRSFLANFWINPARFPDFGWAWLTRFLFIMSYACTTSYLLYFLQDAVHYEQLFHGQSAARGVSTFQLILTVLLLISSIASGIFSDRTQRRKIFVIAAACIMGLALLLLALFPSWPIVELAAAVFGLGYGIYVAVDLALVIQVLPSARNRGKDMGVINIAGTLPQVLAPALIGLIVGTTHSYLVLFVLAAAFSLLAGVLIPRIKGVR